MRAFRGLIDSLQSAVEQLRWQPKRSQWVGYYSEGDSYSEDGLLHKQQIVRRFLEERRPRVVWDLGANTALFSRLAAEQSALTVAFDADPGAVETSYRNSKGVLPLVVDLTNPSPAIGWANRERLSLAERGPADTALVLAIVHHLAIANNVPLPQLADTLSELCRSLVIEFVPKTDPKVQLLLAARDDIFFDYHEAAFEDAFRARFSIDDRVEVRGSNRAIYLMRRK